MEWIAETLRRMAIKYENQLTEGKTLMDVASEQDRAILIALPEF